MASAQITTTNFPIIIFPWFNIDFGVGNLEGLVFLGLVLGGEDVCGDYGSGDLDFFLYLRVWFLSFGTFYSSRFWDQTPLHAGL